MREQMRALVVERPGIAELRRVPTPRPGRSEVLVRVGAAGICGSDVELLDGRRPAAYVRYPIIPGHEWAGVVEATGEEVLCVPAQLVHRLPPGSDLAAAALLEPAACVAQGLLEVELQPGLTAAVVGSGTLGLLAVALLSRAAPPPPAPVGR